MPTGSLQNVKKLSGWCTIKQLGWRHRWLYIPWSIISWFHNFFDANSLWLFQTQPVSASAKALQSRQDGHASIRVSVTYHKIQTMSYNVGMHCSLPLQACLRYRYHGINQTIMIQSPSFLYILCRSHLTHLTWCPWTLKMNRVLQLQCPIFDHPRPFHI
jgi:hypothetical protein